jgi:hypothetical protein
VGHPALAVNQVIEYFDVNEDVLMCQRPGAVDSAFNAFTVEAIGKNFQQGHGHRLHTVASNKNGSLDFTSPFEADPRLLTARSLPDMDSLLQLPLTV